MHKKLILLLLICNAINVNASQVDTLLVASKSMNKSIPNIVIVPDSYSNNKVGFPVVYLLHGADGNYTNWLSKVPDIKKYSDQYNIIIVCPDGGHNSWYFDSPINPQMKYETYLAKELIEKVDENYNTIDNRTGRAITGLSMGGHGAFYLAFKHQDIWGAAGSMSGGVDLRPFPANWDISKQLGDYSKHPSNWEENSIINLVYLLKGDNLKLIFDCGTNDFFYEVNKQLHQKLMNRNIPHDYTERSGSHNWAFWSNSIKYQVLYFDIYFNEQKKSNKH
ncbi:MAG: esterase family protein [Cyclobacteriaceae bacterium]|nr:esterase family protein [Cyclobacteriaceae bacterium]